MVKEYNAQVALLVKVLPYIAKESCFALKGGTAINLFVRNLPRLSVDIDLTYIPTEDRNTSIENINAALSRIKLSLAQAGINANLYKNEHGYAKLNCFLGDVSIKVEPNYILRGTVFPPEKMKVCKTIEEKYGFVSMQVVNLAELYAGKICAALDRQHPRDLFDVKYLIDTGSVDGSMKQSLLIMLLSHNRPFYELVSPNFQSREQEFFLEFKGMTEEDFTYNDHKETFEKLTNIVPTLFTPSDKDFIIGFHKLNPDWKLLDLENVKNLPAIRWKLQNLQKLKKQNIKKYNVELEKVKGLLK